MASFDPCCVAWLREHVCNALKVAESHLDACLGEDNVQALVDAFLAGEGEIKSSNEPRGNSNKSTNTTLRRRRGDKPVLPVLQGGSWTRISHCEAV